MSVKLAKRLETEIGEKHVLGASLAFYANEEIQLAQAGYANLDPKRVVLPETVFQIGSVTKLFTGTLMMMLVDENRVDLDRSVAEYLPNLLLAGRACPEKLTVRMLLNHTSGIDGGFMGDFGDGPDAIRRFVMGCRDVSLLAPPGHQFNYSNAGYVVAGRVIEKVEGEAFDEVLKRRLLRPLGMEHCGSFDDELADFDLAVGYAWDGKSFRLPESQHTPSAHAPAGSRLSMTASDLMRFAIFHMQNGAAPDGQLLSEGAALKMRANTSVAAFPGVSAHISWASFPIGESRLFFHTGATIRQSSVLCLLPQQGVAFVLLTNTSNAAWSLFKEIGRELIEKVVGEPIFLPALS